MSETQIASPWGLECPECGAMFAGYPWRIVGEPCPFPGVNNRRGRCPGTMRQIENNAEAAKVDEKDGAK